MKTKYEREEMILIKNELLARSSFVSGKKQKYLKENCQSDEIPHDQEHINYHLIQEFYNHAEYNSLFFFYHKIIYSIVTLFHLQILIVRYNRYKSY